MKIDFYISSLSGGGAEKVLVTIAEEFAEHGHDVMITTLEKRPQFYFPNSKIHINKILEPKYGMKSFFSDLLFIFKSMNKRSADVSFSFLTRTNLLLLLCCLFNSKKIIVCDRNNPQNEHSSTIFFLSQLLYLRANKIVVQTERIKSMYCKFLNKKLCVIENPIDIEKLEKQFPSYEEFHSLNRIISMGRLEPQKDFETLIDAFDNIADAFPNWKLDIFGIGNRKSILSDYINSKKHASQITLCGRTDRPFYEISKSKIFVLSSFYEGFPNVLCEAMYAKLVCISSDCVSGPNELIDDQKNGYLFKIQDVNKLSKLLSNAIINYEEMDILTKSARNRVIKLDKNTNYIHWYQVVEKVK